jgi:hypothetical protein
MTRNQGQIGLQNGANLSSLTPGRYSNIHPSVAVGIASVPALSADLSAQPAWTCLSGTAPIAQVARVTRRALVPGPNSSTKSIAESTAFGVPVSRARCMRATRCCRNRQGRGRARAQTVVVVEGLDEDRTRRRPTHEGPWRCLRGACTLVRAL